MNPLAFGIARMYGQLIRWSPIEVRVFCRLGPAAAVARRPARNPRLATLSPTRGMMDAALMEDAIIEVRAFRRARSGSGLAGLFPSNGSSVPWNERFLDPETRSARPEKVES